MGFKIGEGTGFTQERATTHDKAVKLLTERLEKRGWKPEQLPVRDHRPDILCRRTPFNRPCLLELKTIPEPMKVGQKRNLAIELDCERDIRERQAQGELVFLVVLDLFDQTWIVVKLDHLKAIKTVRPPNGNGSNDFYSVFENPATNGLGTPAAEFFCDLKGEL